MPHRNSYVKFGKRSSGDKWYYFKDTSMQRVYEWMRKTGADHRTAYLATLRRAEELSI